MRRPWNFLARTARLAAMLAGLALLASVVQVLTVRFVTPPVTPHMVSRVVEHTVAERELRWVDYRPRRYDPDHPVARAAVASEDARFFLHTGFDWDAMCGAVLDAQSGRRLRGASTLTQQVARNLFLWQGRSWVRKALEAWYTVWLELLLPKERILELYLNIAETGPMTFGFEAGAHRWYGVGADALGRDQAGRLVGILPAPVSRRPDGSAAGRRAGFVAAHPAPFPGDAHFDAARTAWLTTRGPLECVGALR